MSTEELLADVIAALARIDLSLDGVAQSLTSGDRLRHARLRTSSLNVDDRALYSAYDSMLDARAILSRQKRKLEVSLAKIDNQPKFAIGDEVQIVHCGDRNNNNGRCGYVSGATPLFLYIVLYRTRSKPQLTVKKMREYVSHVRNVGDVASDSFVTARSNDSNGRSD
jgi:hypothetical protein